MDSLNIDQCPENVNIVTGQIVCHPAINVDMAVEIGEKMEKFEQSWPGGFHYPITKTVNTLRTLRKSIKIGGTNVCNTEAIYARCMALQNSS